MLVAIIEGRKERVIGVRIGRDEVAVVRVVGVLGACSDFVVVGGDNVDDESGIMIAITQT